METPRWMKIPEACRYARMCKKTLLKYIASGEIRGRKRGGHWIIDRESIDQFNSDPEEKIYVDVRRRIGIR